MAPALGAQSACRTCVIRAEGSSGSTTQVSVCRATSGRYRRLTQSTARRRRTCRRKTARRFGERGCCRVWCVSVEGQPMAVTRGPRPPRTHPLIPPPRLSPQCSLPARSARTDCAGPVGTSAQPGLEQQKNPLVAAAYAALKKSLPKVGAAARAACWPVPACCVRCTPAACAALDRRRGTSRAMHPSVPRPCRLGAARRPLSAAPSR